MCKPVDEKSAGSFFYHLLNLISFSMSFFSMSHFSTYTFLAPALQGKSARHKKFTKKVSPFSKKITKRGVRGFFTEHPLSTFTTEYTSIRYIPCTRG